jgi:hypothetical protein
MTRPAWLYALRAVLLVTAAGVMARGDVLYGGFCLAGLGLTLVPAILARALRVRPPRGLELGLLVLLIADMTVGNLLGVYARLPWYDKLLHLGASILVGWIAFLAIGALQASGRIRLQPWLAGVAVLLLTLGVGALWEIAEYAVDALLGRSAQRAPGIAPIDDTMLDLVMDAVGGTVAAVAGALFWWRSAGGQGRVGALVTRTPPRIASEGQARGGPAAAAA